MRKVPSPKSSGTGTRSWTQECLVSSKNCSFVRSIRLRQGRLSTTTSSTEQIWLVLWRTLRCQVPWVMRYRHHLCLVTSHELKQFCWKSRTLSILRRYSLQTRWLARSSYLTSPRFQVIRSLTFTSTSSWSGIRRGPTPLLITAEIRGRTRTSQKRSGLPLQLVRYLARLGACVTKSNSLNKRITGP